MSESTTELFPFNGDQLRVKRDDARGAFVGVRSLAVALGFHDVMAQGLSQEVARQPALDPQATTELHRGKRVAFVAIPIDSVPLLVAVIAFKIRNQETTPTEKREKCDVYLRECRNALAAKFLGAAPNKTTTREAAACMAILSESGFLGFIEKAVEDAFDRRLESAGATLTKRIDGPVHVQNQLVRTIVAAYDGKCGCGCGKEIVRNGSIILDSSKKPIAEFDHFYANNRSGINELWLISKS